MFVKPVGVNSFLQGAAYTTRVYLLTCFAVCFRSGDADTGHQVTVQKVFTSLTAFCDMITLSIGENPTKILVCQACSMFITNARWLCKADPQTAKKMPVEIDFPEYLCQLEIHPQSHQWRQPSVILT